MGIKGIRAIRVKRGRSKKMGVAGGYEKTFRK
jgi:hypothetical protein